MNRNYSVDCLKFLCCFMVICIHMPFPEPLGTLITPITRIAVPIFFMITGYYYSHILEKNMQTEQIFKIIKLYVCANALYLFFSLFDTLISGKTVTDFLSNIFNFKTILKFILLNESPFSGHLWYLGAILYVLIIVYFFEKRWKRNKLYPIVPFMLLLDLIFGKYSLLTFSKSFPYILVRNFLCVGLPYFLIGDMLFKANLKIKSNFLIPLVFLFICSTLAERYLLGIMNLNAIRDHYISTTFLSISVFLLTFQCKKNFDKNLYKKISYIGSKLSLFIYILHPFFINVINKIAKVIINNTFLMLVYNYMAPFLVLFISIIISLAVYTVNNTLKNKLYKKKNSNT